MKHNPAIKKVFAIMLLHAILPAILGLLYINLGQREIAVKTYKDNLLQLARFTATSYEEELAKTKNLLSLMSQLEEVKNNDSENCNQIANVAKNIDTDSNYLYASLGATDKDGNVFCSDSDIPSQGINLYDRGYFQEAKNTGHFSVGGLIEQGRVTGKRVIVAVDPIIDAEGEFKGVTYASIDLDWLNKIAQKIDLPNNYVLALIDKDNVVIARQPYDESIIGKSINGTPLGEILSDKDLHEGVVDAIGLNNQKKVYAYTEIKQNGNHDRMHVYIGVPKEEINKIANASFGRDLIFTILIVAITAAIAAVDWKIILVRQLRKAPIKSQEDKNTL